MHWYSNIHIALFIPQVLRIYFTHKSKNVDNMNNKYNKYNYVQLRYFQNWTDYNHIIM